MRKRFERFCYKHRNWGIPNLMLYIVLGNALVYCMGEFGHSYELFNLLVFDREAIFRGEVWRLVSYVFTFNGSNFLWTALLLVCYFSLGRALENMWGTCRFNLFYFSGIVLMDIYCLIFPCHADVGYLNSSLFLAYATVFPEAQFLIMYIIPVKAWILAVIDLVIVFANVLLLSIPYFLFPFNLFPLVSLANYFLFFGKDVVRVFPVSWRANFRRLFRRKKFTGNSAAQESKPKVVPFPTAGSYQASTATVKAPYTHRCTICGKTDVSDPDLEFRYCSRCRGYHCYCQDHISAHTHIE